MGVNKRSTIKADIPNEIQTGDRLQVDAIDPWELKVYKIDDASQVAPSGTVNYYIYAASGKKARVLGLKLYVAAPAGSSSGSHFFNAGILLFETLMRGVSLFSSALDFYCSNWDVADLAQYPPHDVSQALVMRSLRFTDTDGVKVTYGNQTDVNQNGNRSVDVIVEEMDQ